MVLVVFGHNYFEDFRQDAIYGPLRDFLYQFHMPVFMFLSGFLVFYAYRPIESVKAYRQYLFKRGRKFIPIYFLLSVFYILTDLYLKKYGIEDVPAQIYKMLFSPIRGSAGFLWYLYVLLIFYAVIPLLKILPRKLLYLIALAAFMLTFVPLPYIFSLNLVGKYFFFFITGGLMADHMGFFETVLPRWGLPFLCLFTLLWVNVFTHTVTVMYQATSVAGIVSILYVSSSRWVGKIKLLQSIGRHSFYIYLLNSLVIGIFYLVYHRVGLDSCIPPRIYIVILTILGTMLPLWFSIIEGRLSGRKSDG